MEFKKPFIRYEILLPLQYNDGRSIENEKFEQTWSELVARFETLTLQPQSLEGVWMQKGERLVRLFVDLPDTVENEQFFHQYKNTLKERFQQNDIWMTAQPIRII